MGQVKQLSAKVYSQRMYILYGLLFIIYFVLIFFTNPAQSILQSFHISETANRWYSLILRLPQELVWLAAFFGYLRLSAYTRLIDNERDGRHFKTISYGLLALTIGLPISLMASNIFVLLSRHEVISNGLASALNTYPNLITQIIAYSFIAKGAYSLTTTVKRRISMTSLVVISFIGIIIGMTYCFLVANNGLNPIAHPGGFNPIYHMPNWLMVSTVVVPYLMAWSLGFRSVYDIAGFAKSVPGKLYRRALMHLVVGLAMVITTSIALQFISSLSRQLLKFSSLKMFVIAYIIYAGFAVGYVLIAIGARRLQKIEEV